MGKVKKETKMVSSEGIGLKQLCVNMHGNHSFSWTTPTKLLVSVTHDFIKDL